MNLTPTSGELGSRLHATASTQCRIAIPLHRLSEWHRPFYQLTLVRGRAYSEMRPWEGGVSGEKVRLLHGKRPSRGGIQNGIAAHAAENAIRPRPTRPLPQVCRLFVRASDAGYFNI